MILVTGATGTTGSEIVKQLSSTGAQVRALVRTPEKATAIEELNIEIAKGDFDKPETLDAALSDVESALLLPANTLQQLEQELNFIEAAKRLGTPHVVKFSALGAEEANSPARIANWHAQAEDALEASGIPFTILRPNTFMQNMLGSAPSIQSLGQFYIPVGDTRVSQVDVRDIAAVAVAALTDKSHAGKTYTITGPEALTYTEVAEKLSTVLGKKVTYVNVTPQAFKDALVGAGLAEWYVDALVELQEHVVKKQGSIVTNVVTEVAKKQPITFDQFAHDYAHIFKGE